MSKTNVTLQRDLCNEVLRTAAVARLEYCIHTCPADGSAHEATCQDLNNALIELAKETLVIVASHMSDEELLENPVFAGLMDTSKGYARQVLEIQANLRFARLGLREALDDLLDNPGADKARTILKRGLVESDKRLERSGT